MDDGTFVSKESEDVNSPTYVPPSTKITPDAPTYIPTGFRARREGWTTPFLSPPVSAPPHPMELARNIIVEFEPDPAAAAAAVPDPLIWEPGTMALACIGDNRQMPTSQVFQEGIVYLKARFGHAVGNFIPYIWTSTDEAMIAAREMSGRPKVICDHNSLQIMGSQARAEITRRGEVLMRCSVTLERKATAADEPFDGDTFSVRKILMPEKGKPALKQVIMHRTRRTYLPTLNWLGRGFVEFPGQSFSAVHELKPRRIGRAWMVEMSWDLEFGKILWENWVPPLQP